MPEEERGEEREWDRGGSFCFFLDFLRRLGAYTAHPLYMAVAHVMMGEEHYIAAWNLIYNLVKGNKKSLYI